MVISRSFPYIITFPLATSFSTPGATPGRGRYRHDFNKVQKQKDIAILEARALLRGVERLPPPRG